MSSPVRSMVIASADSTFIGMLSFTAFYGYLNNVQYWWVGIICALYLIYRVANSILRMNNFVSITSEMMDTFALYIFDGDEDSVNKVLNIITSNLNSKPVKQVIVDAINKTKRELPTESE